MNELTRLQAAMPSVSIVKRHQLAEAQIAKAKRLGTFAGEAFYHWRRLCVLAPTYTRRFVEMEMCDGVAES